MSKKALFHSIVTKLMNIVFLNQNIKNKSLKFLSNIERLEVSQAKLRDNVTLSTDQLALPLTPPDLNLNDHS